MESHDIEELRDRVVCAAVLEQAGFAVDARESTRRAIKYRRGGSIIIVIHGGRGWFDPLSDAKGDVFSLVEHIDGVGFVEALKRVADLIGFVPREPIWAGHSRGPQARRPIGERWRMRCKPSPGSSTWRYLSRERGLPETVLRAAIRQNLLREGPHGCMWAAHVDDFGTVTGWEAREPNSQSQNVASVPAAGELQRGRRRAP